MTTPKRPTQRKATRRHRRRQWQVPKNIYNEQFAFAIDDAIRSLQPRLQSRWKLTEAIAFGRRCLEVAIEDAVYENFRPGGELAYWSRVATLADRAHDVLDRLIRHIGPKGPPRADTLVPRERVSTSWVPSGKISIGILPRGLKVDQAKEDNDRLRAALDHLTEFSLRSRERRQGLASKAKNPGDLGKRAFVYRLAEGWIFLTGKKPGRHFDPNRNPFLNFVLAATASHREKADELNFSRALDHALRRLRHKNLVSSLARRGPVWTPDALAASD